MPDLTICIPIGHGHETIAERARNSVKAQTIDVAGVALADKDGKGAGWTRNQMLDRVTTPYVAFLDADDYLMPRYAAMMIAALRRVEGMGKYVYSGWSTYPADQAGAILDTTIDVKPPKKCYCFDLDNAENFWRTHLVTAILPTEWARSAGGFDEQLPGMEDTDFFHKLHEAGHCGYGIDEPLVFYDTKLAIRSVELHKRPDLMEIKAQIGQRYNKPEMSCCGGSAIDNTGPFNEKQPGDVLASVLGNTQNVYVGRATARIYQLGGYGQLMWVNAGDAEQHPQRFKVVESSSQTFQEAANRVIGGQTFKGAQTVVSAPPPREESTNQQGPIPPSVLARMAGFSLKPRE